MHEIASKWPKTFHQQLLIRLESSASMHASRGLSMKSRAHSRDVGMTAMYLATDVLERATQKSCQWNIFQVGPSSVQICS